MIENLATTALLDALNDGPGGRPISAVLAQPDLALMLPAVGLRASTGIRYLEAVRDRTRRVRLDESGQAVVAYFDELLRRRDEFETLVGALREDEAALSAAAFAKTQTLLPGSCQLGSPRFVPLPLGYDFRTDRETVYMDPLASLALGPEGIQATWAHELHHVGRYRLTKENLTLMRPAKRPSNHPLRTTVARGVAWLEAEGIADCVSSALQTPIPALGPALEIRRQQIVDFDRLLRGLLDRVGELRRQLEPPESKIDSLGADFRSLAHPIGARMAAEILSAGGHPGLTECVGKPWTFLSQYDLVARRKGFVEFGDDIARWLFGR